MTDSYIAATRGTSDAGGYAGVVTWSDWGTKKALDEFIAHRNDQEVVEEDITEERAIELSRMTPRACYIEAALDEATDSAGNINRDILSHKLQILG